MFIKLAVIAFAAVVASAEPLVATSLKKGAPRHHHSNKTASPTHHAGKKHSANEKAAKKAVKSLIEAAKAANGGTESLGHSWSSSWVSSNRHYH